MPAILIIFDIGELKEKVDPARIHPQMAYQYFIESRLSAQLGFDVVKGVALYPSLVPHVSAIEEHTRRSLTRWEERLSLNLRRFMAGKSCSVDIIDDCVEIKIIGEGQPNENATSIVQRLYQ